MEFVWLPQKRPGLAYIGVFHRPSIKLVPSIVFSQKTEGHFGSLSQRPWKEVNMMPSNTNNSPSDWYWDILRRLSSGSTRNMVFSKSQRLRQSWQSSSASQSLPSFSLASHCHRLGKSRRPRVPYIRHWKRMSRANSESSWSGKISLLRVPSWNTHLKESFLKSIFWAKHITTSTASLAGLLTKCGSKKSLNPLYSQNNMLCFWCWLLVICTVDWVFNHKTLEKFSALCCMPVVQTLFSMAVSRKSGCCIALGVTEHSDCQGPGTEAPNTTDRHARYIEGSKELRHAMCTMNYKWITVVQKLRVSVSRIGLLTLTLIFLRHKQHRYFQMNKNLQSYFDIEQVATGK